MDQETLDTLVTLVRISLQEAFEERWKVQNDRSWVSKRCRNASVRRCRQLVKALRFLSRLEPHG